MTGYDGFDDKIKSLNRRFDKVTGFTNLISQLKEVKESHNSAITQVECELVQKELNGALKTRVERQESWSFKRPRPEQKTQSRHVPVYLGPAVTYSVTMSSKRNFKVTATVVFPNQQIFNWERQRDFSGIVAAE